MDQLAVEHFRTIVRTPIDKAADDAYEGGASIDDIAVTEGIVAQFPEAYYEFRTNDAGVPVRRLVLHGEWQVDLTVTEQAARVAP